MRNFSRSYAFFIDIDNNIWYYISAINEYILRKVGRMIKVEIRESKKLNDAYSAYVSFKYDSKIVTELRALPFKFYNASNQEWEIPITKLDSFVKKLNDFEFTFCGDLSKLKLEEKQVELPEGFEFKTKPFKHQLEGVEYGLTHDNWFLGDEQGLGKTKQIIDIAVARKLIYGYKHCLIVCGVNTLKWNWVNEILTHSNEYAYILGQKATRDGKIKIGSMSDKLKDLTIIENDKDCIQPYFIITNVESFRDKNFADTIKKLCDKGIINMCAADEMHKMKNPTAQQTNGFLKCLPQCRIGMTGTPLMNSPLDLYVILKWLGFEKHTFSAFKKHYCVMGGFGGYEVVGYKNMDQLTAQINEIMLRRLKSEVLDLPDKTYVDEFVEMGSKQAALYKEVEVGIKTNLANGEINLVNPLSALIRLRQCTGYTGILSDNVFESAKLERMKDLVEECVANKQKCIIFSNWAAMTDIIMEELGGMGFKGKAITGATKDEERQTIVENFQTDPNQNYIVGTIGAMGTGLTLTAATTVIFMDEPWNRALYDQAVDRAHRIGQKNNITIYNLLTKDTIDERIHEIVYKKGTMSDAIIDGKGVMSREVFEYLLG